ncbi:hypothetical protein ACR5KS_08450 [Leucobacter sp. W1153]|uniref:hypothetical protein n=1 Tax=Leucobacter sp. W1153 TaxID=3439064 RepID=UPI003F3B240C
MKTSRIRKVVAGFALAVAALVAVPAAAQANGYTPVPNESYTGQTVVAPGGTTTITFGASVFTPGETVRFVLTGENAAGATLASFYTVVNSSPAITKTALAGGTPVAVTLPANASGTYSLNASSPSKGNVSVAISVGSAGTGGAASGGAGTGLATTGAAGDQLLWAWVAGGALAFVGGGVLVASAVRKQRKLAE